MTPTWFLYQLGRNVQRPRDAPRLLLHRVPYSLSNQCCRLRGCIFAARRACTWDLLFDSHVPKWQSMAIHDRIGGQSQRLYLYVSLHIFIHSTSLLPGGFVAWYCANYCPSLPSTDLTFEFSKRSTVRHERFGRFRRKTAFGNTLLGFCFRVAMPEPHLGQPKTAKPS